MLLAAAAACMLAMVEVADAAAGELPSSDRIAYVEEKARMGASHNAVKNLKAWCERMLATYPDAVRVTTASEHYGWEPVGGSKRCGGEPCEVFAVLFLDNKHRVIGFEKMFYGTVDGAAVYPREVVRRALEYNAASVIVAHNHPSGVAEPSQADRDVTERLRRALDLVDVRILDHLVIGDGHWESFSRRGWV